MLFPSRKKSLSSFFPEGLFGLDTVTLFYVFLFYQIVFTKFLVDYIVVVFKVNNNSPHLAQQYYGMGAVPD